MGFKKKKYANCKLDYDLFTLIKDIQQTENISFREASKSFANKHKKMRWKLDAGEKLFNFALPATACWGLGYMVLMSVL